jgi:hypothetical protein
MEIRVNVPEELVTQARTRGVPVKDFIEEVLAKQVIYVVMTKRTENPVVEKVTADSTTGKQARTPEQIRAWLDALAQFSDKIPPLPESISREWIYQDHE